MTDRPNAPGFDTLALHAGWQPDPATGARFLINEKMMVDGQGKGLVGEETHEGGYTVSPLCGA